MNSIKNVYVVTNMISLLVVLFQWFLPCVLVFFVFLCVCVFVFFYPFYFILIRYCVLKSCTIFILNK